jgi:hypothetical protein
MVDMTNRYSSGGGGQQVLDLRTDKGIWNERMEEGAAFYNRTPLPCCSALRLPGSDPDGTTRQGRDGDGVGTSYECDVMWFNTRALFNTATQEMKNDDA